MAKQQRHYIIAGGLFIFLFLYDFLQGTPGVIVSNLRYLIPLLRDNTFFEFAGRYLRPILYQLLSPTAYILLAVTAFRGCRGKPLTPLWEIACSLLAVNKLWQVISNFSVPLVTLYYWTYSVAAVLNIALTLLWVLYGLSGRLVPVLVRRRPLIVCGFAVLYILSTLVCVVELLVIPELDILNGLLPLLFSNLQSAALCFGLWLLGRERA